MLIVSLPNTEWADFEQASTPNLDKLFASAAIGAMVTNGVDRPTPLPSGYVTIGARRAVANGSTGNQGFGVGEDFGRDRAGVVFATRTGIAAGHGLVYMPIADTVTANDDELFGAEPGLLGDEFGDRGDLPRGDHQRRRHRPQHARHPVHAVAPRHGVATLMTSTGPVPAG